MGEVKKQKPANIRKGARKLQRADGLYRWFCGVSNVEVWEPNGTKHVVSFKNLLGFDWGDVGEHEKIAVLPSDIEELILRSFKPAKVPYRPF